MKCRAHTVIRLGASAHGLPLRIVCDRDMTSRGESWSGEARDNCGVLGN